MKGGRHRRRAARPLVEAGMSRTVTLPKRVTLFEMGARDGLQNESELVSADDKIRYIDLLSETGLALDRSDVVRQPESDSAARRCRPTCSRAFARAPGVRYPVLAPNLKGYERAKAAGADAIAVFTAASEHFTKRNINMTIDESLETFRDVVRAAKNDGMWVRGYVSTAFGSPFGDEVTPHAVVDVSVKLMEMGCDELSIGDTIGVGVPSQVDELVPLLAAKIPLDRLAMHFHDTRGTALANVYAALQNGVTSSIRRPAAWAAAPTRPARPATSAPKTCSTCCTGWASRPASISRKFAPPRASSPASSATRSRAKPSKPWKPRHRARAILERRRAAP